MGNPERLGSNKWLPSNPEAGDFFQSAAFHCYGFISGGSGARIFVTVF